MTALVLVELRRIMARRLVHVFVGVAIVAILIGAVITFARSGRAGVGATFPGVVSDHRFHLVRLWPGHGETGTLGALAGLVSVGALVGGASMLGAEWRAGTMTLLLTWEPRRARVLLAKTVPVLVCAAVIAFVLQAILVGAVLPAAVVRGTTEGTDWMWVRGLLAAMARVGAMAGVWAVIGFSIAAIGRNTAAAVGGTFVYVTFIEGLVRAWRPGWRGWFLGENTAAFVTGHGSATGARHGVVAAAATVAAYALALWIVGLMTFTRRDVT